MGRERKKRRSMKIKQAQKRGLKLNRLRKKYSQASMDSDKERIWGRVVKIAPWLTKEEFLARIKKVEKQESDEDK